MAPNVLILQTPGEVLARDAQRLILPLVRDTFNDFRVAGILGDVLCHAYPLLAARLHERPSVMALLWALEVGDWRGRAAASRARGELQFYSRLIVRDRRDDLALCEVEPGKGGYLNWSDAERVGIEHLDGFPFTNAEWRWAAGVAAGVGHCRLVLETGLDGGPKLRECGSMYEDLVDDIEAAINGYCV